ncbi:hypothetical protein JTE90_009119 [Oedothorax gibbosus]|uniref:Uncharacterized protein n=1 Tax=Oedothorax gibbosus TaxID=931172 RepID=A0AAV6THP3_9ARAC|nr:hypothetical protein JTE90_009119 [Oedothorax gibbosus]
MYYQIFDNLWQVHAPSDRSRFTVYLRGGAYNWKKKFETDISHILTYSPWMNNVKKHNFDIKNTILAWDGQTDIELKLDVFKMVYNDTIQPCHGYKPKYLFYVRDEPTILDLGCEDMNREAFALPVLVNKMKNIILEVNKVVETNRLAYKKRQSDRSKKKTVKRKFEVGDTVYYVLNPFKLKRKSYAWDRLK